MSRQKFLESKMRLRRMLRKVIADCEQLRTDIESWNENRPDAMPFDVGGDIALAALAREMLATVESEKPIPEAMWNRFIEPAEANANT